MHWEAIDGAVYVTEDCLEGPQLPNRSICLRLGGGDISSTITAHLYCDDSIAIASTASPILDISAESISEECADEETEAAVTVWLCIVQEDGNIHTLKCFASSSKYSVLEELVVAMEGDSYLCSPLR